MSLSVDCEGSTIAVADAAGWVHLRAAKEGGNLALVAKLDTKHRGAGTGTGSSRLAVSFHPFDSNTLCVTKLGSRSSCIEQLDRRMLERGPLRTFIPGPSTHLTGAATWQCSYPAKLLAAGCADGIVAVWNSQSSHLTATPEIRLGLQQSQSSHLNCRPIMGTTWAAKTLVCFDDQGNCTSYE